MQSETLSASEITKVCYLLQCHSHLIITWDCPCLSSTVKELEYPRWDICLPKFVHICPEEFYLKRAECQTDGRTNVVVSITVIMIHLA